MNRLLRVKDYLQEIGVRAESARLVSNAYCFSCAHPRNQFDILEEPFSNFSLDCSLPLDGALAYEHIRVCSIIKETLQWKESPETSSCSEEVIDFKEFTSVGVNAAYNLHRYLVEALKLHPSHVKSMLGTVFPSWEGEASGSMFYVSESFQENFHFRQSSHQLRLLASLYGSVGFNISLAPKSILSPPGDKSPGSSRFWSPDVSFNAAEVLDSDDEETMEIFSSLHLEGLSLRPALEIARSLT